MSVGPIFVKYLCDVGYGTDERCPFGIIAETWDHAVEKGWSGSPGNATCGRHPRPSARSKS